MLMWLFSYKKNPEIKISLLDNSSIGLFMFNKLMSKKLSFVNSKIVKAND